MKNVMKTVLAIALSLVLVLSLAACGGEKAPFEVGKDTATYEMDGHGEWASTYSANVKIVSGDDVIFNGVVTLTSDNMYASEFTYAALTEKGVSQDGTLSGFVNSIGSYANGNNAENVYMFWGFSVNGKMVNWACNDMHILEGDYLLWEFQAYEG